jgi:competence protein ComEC
VIAFLSFLVFISFSLFIKTLHLIYLAPVFFLCIYGIVQKKNILLIVFLSMMLMFTARIAMQKHTPMESPSIVLVIESRTSYVIVSTGLKRYHLEQAQDKPYAVGDVLSIQSKILPLVFQTYESSFDFKAYLHTKGVYHRLSLEQIEVVFSSPIRLLEVQRSYLEMYPSSLQPYVSQLLFNYSDNSALNTVYLIFISGLGFSMMFDLLQKPLKTKFPKEAYLPFLLLFPYVFMHMHRFSIVRVFLFKGLDTYLYKNPHRWILKITVLFIFVMIFPHMIYQTGLYLYIAYQIYFKLINKLIPRFPIYYQTVGLWVYTMIIQHLFFQSIAPLSIIIYLPLSALNSVISFLLLVGFYLKVSHPSINFILSLYVSLVEGVKNISPQIILPQWSMALLFSFIVLIFLFFLGLHYQARKMMKASMILVVTVFTLHLTQIPAGWFEQSIHFINVGQGDATLIRQGRTNVLIDTGGQRHLDIATEVLIPYFKKIGVYQLDAVIITHGDFDHDGALPSLQNNFRVQTVIRQRFTSLKVGNISLQQWNTKTSDDENDNSLVLSLSVHQCSILLMGDASILVEAAIIDVFPLRGISILRIGHHGSLTSTSELFLDTIQPKTAIISLSATNSYGHPHPEVLERLTKRNINTRRTDIEGTIVMNSCKI